MNICELTVVQGHQLVLGRIIIIHNDQQRTVGRSSACDFKFDDDMMSGMHAQVLYRDGWIVRDLLSRNGVLVNQAAIHQHPLEPGDTIQVGQTLFEFSESGKQESKHPSQPDLPDLMVIQLADSDDSQVEQIDPLRQTQMVSGPLPDLPDGKKPLGRQIEKRGDLELAKLAIKNDQLNHAQLQECIDIQHEMREVKIHMTLEEIFQEREYLDKQQIQRLVREYKFTRRRTKDLFYGEVAVGNKLIERKKVDICLAEQEEAFEAGDKIPYLGELLVKKGYISIGDNNRIIRGIKQYKEGDDDKNTKVTTKRSK